MRRRYRLKRFALLVKTGEEESDIVKESFAMTCESNNRDFDQVWNEREVKSDNGSGLTMVTVWM